MREILFRGKAINRAEDREYRTNYKNGDWVYGLVTKMFDERYKEFPVEMTNTDGIGGIEVDYRTIGQCTGLTDKNGKKIFEGDIVQNTITKVPAIVRWYSEYSAFILYCKKYSRVYFLYDNDFKYIEVIGNIHDNRLEDFYGC